MKLNFCFPCFLNCLNHHCWSYVFTYGRWTVIKYNIFFFLPVEWGIFAELVPWPRGGLSRYLIKCTSASIQERRRQISPIIRGEKARPQGIRHATRAGASSSMYIIPKTLFYLFKVVTFPGQHISRRLLPLRRAVVTAHTVCNNARSIKGTCTFSFTSPQRIKTQTVRSVELEHKEQPLFYL